MTTKKIAFVWGTRPELIKLSRVIDAISQMYEVHNIYTGQHYDEKMLGSFTKSFNIKNIIQNPSTKDIPYSEQLGFMLSNTMKAMELINPDLVIVQGDTNSTLTGAISANKLGKPILHIEAGGRSRNRSMPEENNRIMVDHISDILISYDEESFQNLKREGLSDRKLFNLSNTSYEVCHYYSKQVVPTKESFQIITTCHRAENTNNLDFLKKYVELLSHLSEKYSILLPLHPRTKKSLKNYKLLLPEKVKVVDPIGYLEMISHINQSEFVITDSGGLVDDSLILNKPVIVYRAEMEHNDLIEKGLVHLANPKNKLDILKEEVDNFIKTDNLKAVAAIEKKFDKEMSKKILTIIDDHFTGQQL